MRAAFLQISDIHISGPGDPVIQRADAIVSAVRAQLPEHSSLVMACTGDVADAGAETQYECALRLLNLITEKLRAIPGLDFLGSVSVPGNHDCNFATEGDARPVLLTSVAAKLESVDLNGDSVSQLIRVQDAFFKFEQAFTGRVSKTATERISWAVLFSSNGNKMLVRCLNTALFSRLKEAAAQLCFPLRAFPAPEEASEIAVTMFHHPYGWLSPDNARELRRAVESHSDLVLTGHEHVADSHVRTDRAEEETSYVEGAALQGSGQTGFNLILIDDEAATYQVFPYHWDGDIYRPERPVARVFTRKHSLIKSSFLNNDAFSQELNDVGTGFSHPNKDLTLRDLFVYPELRLASLSTKNQTNIHSWDVLSFVQERAYLHISGPPLSGKSTLARALYLDLQRDHGLVPLLLDAQDIAGASEAEIDKAIEKEFSREYQARQYEHFRQLDASRKVLLIDDWHRSRIRADRKTKTVAQLRCKFGKVVLFSDELSLLQLLGEAAEHDEPSNDVEYCEIKQFGFRLRSDLIRKWHSIGADPEPDELALTHKIATTEHVLDTLVGKGIIPSWPIFILSLLQESSIVAPETASFGSYGHLYEALPTKRLAVASKRPETLGLKYTYLSMVGFAMFRAGRTSLAESEMRHIHRQYEEEYQIRVDEVQLWGELATAHVLAKTGDEFRFQYKYAYYFSVAKYFQQGIGNVTEAATLRAQLSSMVRSVHDEDHANIIILYIYLTKDRIVIEEMLQVAARIFADTELASLTTDVDFVNKLRDRSPDVVLEKGDIASNRTEYRAGLDERPEPEAPESNPVRIEYRDDISDAIKIEFSFKSLQVLGQVVKNFPLDLKGDLKVAITKQSYELILRTLRKFLNIIEWNMAELISVLDTALSKTQPFSKKGPEALRDASYATIIRLVEYAIFGSIKRLSLAVGVKDLRETYDQVREMMGDAVPTALIDLSIKLDHFGNIPVTDVEELERRLRDNITAYTILKLLVAEFLHLFPCDYRVEQRMVQLFNFQPHVTKLSSKKVKQLS